MRGVFLAVIAVLVLSSAAAAAAVQERTVLEAHLARNPYDDRARAGLIAVCRDAGDSASAYYQAAWLTWLGASAYVESDAGAGLLRDRSLRDRAARSQPRKLLPIALAAEAEQLAYSTCLNGAIAQQARRLRGDLETMQARAEQAAAEADPRDPVIRLAMAHLAVTLDSVMVFDEAQSSSRERIALLRSAASRAGAVAAWFPDAPGPHRTLAVIRARLAELDGGGAYWDLAIEEATRALALDPDDLSLPELLWTFHLRAGHWEDARLWQRRVEAASAPCPAE